MRIAEMQLPEPKKGNAMSFEQIAAEMRTSPSNVRNLYCSAMKKLRLRPEMLRRLRATAQAKQMMRHG